MKKNWFIIFIFFYIFIVLFFPLVALLNNLNGISFELFIKRAFEPVAVSTYQITIKMAFIATILNIIFGFTIAWVLTRYNFFGKNFLDSCIDLPFALPTSVAGLALVTIYGKENFIGFFLQKWNIEIIFTELGITIAMIFVSFPFVIRTLQPVLQKIEKDLEEVAWSLGASRWKTFLKVVFPNLLPAILTGASLSFSRSIGEYGSIVIISSNFPFKDLVTSVLIFQTLEQYDYIGATIIGTVSLILSLILLLFINFFQSWNQQTIKY